MTVQMAADATTQEPATIRPMITGLGRKVASGSFDWSVCVALVSDAVAVMVAVDCLRERMLVELEVSEVSETSVGAALEMEVEEDDSKEDEGVEEVVEVEVGSKRDSKSSRRLPRVCGHSGQCLREKGT